MSFETNVELFRMLYHYIHLLGHAKETTRVTATPQLSVQSPMAPIWWLESLSGTTSIWRWWYIFMQYWKVQSRQRDNPLPPTITYDCQKIQEAPPPFFNPSHPHRNGHLFRFLRPTLLLFCSHQSSSALIVDHNLQFNCVLTNMFMMTVQWSHPWYRNQYYYEGWQMYSNGSCQHWQALPLYDAGIEWKSFFPSQR